MVGVVSVQNSDEPIQRFLHRRNDSENGKGRSHSQALMPLSFLQIHNDEETKKRSQSHNEIGHTLQIIDSLNSLDFLVSQLANIQFEIGLQIS